MSETRPTAIVVDSTKYLPQELLASEGIGVVSLYVTLEGHQQREVDIPDYGEFYDRLKAASEGATTSQPSVGDFLEVWLPRLEAGREVVSIHLSSLISGTHETAITAREQLLEEGRGGDRVHLVDSRASAGADGLCTLAAIAAAKRGEPAADVAEAYAAARATQGNRLAVDTLEYLRRGGRIGGAQALLGTALRIKPILSFEDEVVAVDKVRTRSRALQYLRDYATEQAALGPRAWCVQHTADRASAHALAGDCREIMGSEPAFVTEIGPVLGSHSGPGVIAFGSIAASTLEG